MILVGLTGGIATGKTTVARLFKEFGVAVIDADVIARQVISRDTDGANKIRQAFGEDVFHNNGEVNREKLGNIVFSNKRKRRLLNSIVHPLVRYSIMWQVLGYAIQGYNYLILDVPLLFENKSLLPFISFTIVVSCTKDQQLNRLTARNNLSQSAAQLRIAAQLPLEEKIKLATYVIDNSGAYNQTRLEVDHIYRQLGSQHRHWYLRGIVLCMLSLIVAFVYYLI